MTPEFWHLATRERATRSAAKGTRQIVQVILHCLLGVCLVLAFTPERAIGHSPGQWVLVTTPAFGPTLAPLIAQRRAEGFDVVVLDTTNVLTPEQLRRRDGSPLQARLNTLFHQHPGRNYLLLAGVFDTLSRSNTEAAIVPGLRGKVGRMRGKACDCDYGLPGPDGAPTVAVGRFPARNVEELRAMVLKTLNFERDTRPAEWQDRLLLMIGNPGGGGLAEWYVEQTLAKDLGLLYPGWEARILVSIASSPFYMPWPQDRRAALQSLHDGALFSVYLGHSGAAGMGLYGWFIPRRFWATLSIPRGAGPFFTCGCFACQSSRTQGEGYGLTAMRNPAGPVAVIGATGESYTAPGQLAAEGLLSCLSHPPFPSRLGDYWLAVQAGLARGKMDPITFRLLDMADGSNGSQSLAMQRLEHLEMWMLLGDPALRLPVVPVDISLRVSKPLVAGRSFHVTGILPGRLRNATVHLTLARPLNSTPLDLETSPSPSPQNRQARLRAFAANFQRANSFILATAEAKTHGREFTAALAVPAQLPWTNLVLRARATLDNESGVGVISP
jgi:Peptidase family C25